MNEPVPKRPRTSVGHTLLRILLWVAPGIASTAFLIVFFISAFSNAHGSSSAGLSDEVVFLAGLLGVIGLTIGAGVFDTVLHLTRSRGRSNFTAGAVAGWTATFVLAQVLLIPLILSIAFMACTAST